MVLITCCPYRDLCILGGMLKATLSDALGVISFIKMRY